MWLAEGYALNVRVHTGAHECAVGPVARDQFQAVVGMFAITAGEKTGIAHAIVASRLLL